MRPGPTVSSYSPQAKLAGLDALRALAVLSVFLFHATVLPWGWLGVQAFFVLSGYLITGLLYKDRDARLGEYLRQFYGRRALRIFPLYFVTLALFWVAGRFGLELHGVKKGLPFALTYTYNWYHATASFEHSKLISHFWSLCVEEQFYLVWPFVIYFCPPTRLKSLMLVIVSLGPWVRGLEWWVLSSFPTYLSKEPDIALYVLTPTHLDAFAAGALSALFPLRDPRRALVGSSVALAIGGAAVLLCSPQLSAATLGYPLGLKPGYAFIWGYTLLNGSAALLIQCLVRRQVAARFFDLRPLRYVGKISYGFYLLHFPLQSLTSKLLPDRSLGVRMLVQLAATLALAALSYDQFESRLLGMKDRWFPRLERARSGSSAEVPARVSAI